MITEKEIQLADYRQNRAPLKMGAFPDFLVATIKAAKLGASAYKLDFYDRFLNFLRVAGLGILHNNRNLFDRDFLFNPDLNDQSQESLLEFLLHFDLVQTASGNTYRISENYHPLIEADFYPALLTGTDKKALLQRSALAQKLADDYYFVNDLVSYYRNPKSGFNYIKTHRRKCAKLIDRKELDYEIRLSETLLHLADYRAGQKIASPFPEDYYTESGRNAFNNFTRFHFPGYLRQLSGGNENLRVFDLGCGYGNYLRLIRENFPEAQLTGIEINPLVAAATQKEFSGDRATAIINDDFFVLEHKTSFDFILMNYVLFYFNTGDQKKVLEKAGELLSENGSIILCQYFSGLEPLKNQLAKKRRENGLFQKIVRHYSDKILYANTLWNDSVDTFSSAVKWDRLCDALSESGLRIKSIAPADKYYYSLFVEIGKKA